MKIKLYAIGLAVDKVESFQSVLFRSTDESSDAQDICWLYESDLLIVVKVRSSSERKRVARLG